MEKTIIGLILSGLGLIFFFNSKNIGAGAYKFYRWFYTEARLIIMFKACGILLIIGGLIIAFKA